SFDCAQQGKCSGVRTWPAPGLESGALASPPGRRRACGRRLRPCRTDTASPEDPSARMMLGRAMPHPTRLSVLLLLAPLAAQPEPTRFRSLELPGGGVLEYALRLPPDHAAGEAYPMLVGLLGADATRDRAEAALDQAFAACTTEFGHAVVVPFGAAAGEPAALAALLRRLRIDHRITGARLDLAGIDTGVEPAFAIALRQPFQFRTLIAVEGVLPDAERCGALRDVRVRLVERPAERYA